ncbi:MAG: glycyl-radical enzyme activating protein [Candidatus Hydrogenedens sp.]|nr:glycyl-radical enzyme activating protein [Candidatus Hydrogenedentota bacterium]NLF58934.1 glycyl-radical enzyme activating protein [Candidatus Hydrogenedens sp.]
MGDASVTGVVFDIQRMCVHDGPGIRTTVFLKGCPLRCDWCHNPEGVSPAPELLYRNSLCLLCGECAERCPHDAHEFTEEGGHRLNRLLCQRCFACVAVCGSDALARSGTEMSVEAVMAEALRDQPFYGRSGGGLTLSGGEPFLQKGFALALLAAAKAAGLHTCVETCCAVPWETLEAALPLVDLFLADYKETDPGLHKERTGRDNAQILENLARLDAAGAPLVLRCPLIPGVNLRDGHLEGVAALANRLTHCRAVHIMGYHPGGLAKRGQAGGPAGVDSLPARPMGRAALESAAERLRELGLGKTLLVM